METLRAPLVSTAGAALWLFDPDGDQLLTAARHQWRKVYVEGTRLKLNRRFC